MSLFSALKKDSRRALKGNWGKAVVVLLIPGFTQMLFLIIALAVVYVLFGNMADYTPLKFIITGGELGNGLVVEYNIIDILIFTGIFLGTSLFDLIVFSPLRLGSKQWYYKLVRGEEVIVRDVFYYYEGWRRYFKSIWFTISLGVRKAIWGIILSAIPVGIILTGTYFVYYREVFFSEPAYKIIFIAAIILGAVLMVGAIVAMIYILNKYFIAEYIIAQNGLSPRRAIKVSAEYTKRFRFSIFSLGMTFVGWSIAASVFPPLLLYVIPYLEATMGIYALYIVSKNKRERPETEII